MLVFIRITSGFPIRQHLGDRVAEAVATPKGAITSVIVIAPVLHHSSELEKVHVVI